ncbi:ABC transporter substrate-binding protein [Candidatus Peregrinibacteria bacterium]|nr:ABC transporter substrate-binding protein [Candidatus Peregrinibacteria bacterium]
MKTKLKALAVVGIIGILAGCTPIFDDTVPVQENGSTTPSVQTTNTITIGALLPLTGEKAAIGGAIKQSMQLALDKANADFTSAKFAIDFFDDACTEETAKTAMNDLITVKKVKVVIGGVCDAATLAAAQIAEQNKVVFFSPANGNPALTTAGDFIFRNYQFDSSTEQLSNDSNKYPALAEFLSKFAAGSISSKSIQSAATSSYDAVLIIREAIDKVGEEPSKIKDYLYTIKGRKGLGTNLSFDANGDPSGQVYSTGTTTTEGTSTTEGTAGN